MQAVEGKELNYAVSDEFYVVPLCLGFISRSRFLIPFNQENVVFCSLHSWTVPEMTQSIVSVDLK